MIRLPIHKLMYFEDQTVIFGTKRDSNDYGGITFHFSSDGYHIDGFNLFEIHKHGLFLEGGIGFFEAGMDSNLEECLDVDEENRLKIIGVDLI